jgi:DNA invertase Pin-like site-specific DNA recombinase
MKKLKWLIYCRVSSTKQVTDWSGLSSQEQTCRNYARNILWVEIEKVFNEEGISGGIFERKSINELLAYIDVNKQDNYVVIFEDLNRLSRDIQVHGLLRSEFKKRWVELACPNFQFDETPEWNFKENISVVVSEYERKKNQQRVIDRQQARLEQWFWCFCLPIWYKYDKDPRGGKIVVKNEDNYKIVKKW